MSMDYASRGMPQSAMTPELTDAENVKGLSPREEMPVTNVALEATSGFSDDDLFEESYEGDYDAFLGFDASYFEL